MGIFARLLGGDTKVEKEIRTGSRLQEATRERTRCELISMAVRDTLKRHGLAAGCITADALPSTTSGKHRGMHIQMIFRDWQPNLLAYVVALESAVRSRLERLDPLSPAWITGVSWRFEPKDRTVCPQLPAAAGSLATAGAANSVRVRPAAHQSIAALEKLLQSGDRQFSAAGRTQADFSPTLPMAR